MHEKEIFFLPFMVSNVTLTFFHLTNKNKNTLLLSRKVTKNRSYNWVLITSTYSYLITKSKWNYNEKIIGTTMKTTTKRKKDDIYIHRYNVGVILFRKVILWKKKCYEKLAYKKLLT